LPASSDANHGVWGCGVTIQYNDPATQSGILSIPGAAFDHPFEDGYNAGQTQTGDKLQHFDNGTGAQGTYLAQVNLPHGAKVTKMTMYYQDTNYAGAMRLSLQETYLGESYEMAWLSSVDDIHKLDTTDIDITLSTIDNYFSSYWAYVSLPPTNLSLWAVTIEYTLPAKDGGYQAISNAAFTPFYDGYDYQNHGRWLFHQNSNGNGGADGIYVAPVNLPQGATVEGMGFNYYDGSVTLNGNGILARSKLGSYEIMGQAPSSVFTGYHFSFQSTIAFNTIDNSQYSYFVVFVLPVTAVHNPPASGDILGCKAMIVYTYNYYAYLPAVRK